jgi:hypothetical protein
MKYILILGLFLTSCSKKEQLQQTTNKPVLVQVEAVHDNEYIVTSPIVTAR